VLVDDQALFVKGRALRAAKRLLGDGLLTSEGADHLRRRRLIQPIFHSSMIDRYGDEMVAAAGRTAARWRDRKTVDVNAEMMRLALDIVGRTIFAADVEAGAPEIREVLEAGMRVFHRFLLPGAELLWRAPLPATRRFNTAKADIDAMIAHMIAERRDHPAEPPGLLDHLLALRDEAGRRLLSDKEIRDEAITLMLAGHETTAQALTWTWLLLGQHPAAAERMRAELDGVLGGEQPRAADYARLPYTQAVLREALRLYPPVWASFRTAPESLPLGDALIPKGDLVAVSPWVTQRDPRFWPEPLRFDPARDAGPDGAFFPFAGLDGDGAARHAARVMAALAGRWAYRQSEPGLTPAARWALEPAGGARLKPVPRP
jgi:cytochrome P450